MLERARAGRSALLVAATGAGKTLAGFLPTICDLAEIPAEGLHSLYISPLKALAVDVQRNLLSPIEEMDLPIRVETRTGDTPSERKARQRVRPPQILLTTPESLSLLLSYPESATLFASLKTVIVDEIHAFAREKRGDLLSLALARLRTLAPDARRVGLSATVADPDAYRGWLAPHGDEELVDVVIGEPGADPDLSILIPEDKVPWGGHSAVYAAAQVIDLIKQHKTTLVFTNTRSLCELTFQELWSHNDEALPIGIHHGSLDIAARRKVEAAMADGKLRALVATASLDLGIDWGDVELVIQMERPRARRACSSASAAPTIASTSPARALLSPATALNISRHAPPSMPSTNASSIPNLPPWHARRARPAHPRHRLRRPIRGGRTARRNSVGRALRRPYARALRRNPQLHRHRWIRAQSL
jgi:ATP-dependent Lhr-like helicase